MRFISLFAGIGGLGGQMPKGSKPKVYPSDFVMDVARLYAKGLTQHEVAAKLGTSQHVIWRAMLRHGISARPAIKRDQSGHKNSSWRGEAVSYSGAHLRVAAVRGKPAICEECGRSGPGQFDWANLSGQFHDVNDYKRLCRSCHWKMDGKIRNITGAMPR